MVQHLVLLMLQHLRHLVTVSMCGDLRVLCMAVTQEIVSVTCLAARQLLPQVMLGANLLTNSAHDFLCSSCAIFAGQYQHAIPVRCAMLLVPLAIHVTVKVRHRPA